MINVVKNGKMKFYNPFKWHVVTDSFGNVYVRKWSIFGWIFMSSGTYSIWHDKQYVNEYCRFKSAEEAFEAACMDYSVLTRISSTDNKVNK